MLVLTVDDPTVPYLRRLTQEFIEALQAAPNPPTLYFEPLDQSRFEGQDYLEGLRDWLRRKYHGKRIDLVVPLGKQAVTFLAQKGGNPWPDVPMIFFDLGIFGIEAPKELPPNTAGVLFEDHFAAALGIIKVVLPDTRHVVIAHGLSELERTRAADRAGIVRAVKLDLDPILWAGKSIPAMISESAHLPPHTVVVFSGPLIDSTGRSVSGTQFCEQFAAAAAVPLVGLVPLQDLGCGALGGLMRDWTRAGRIVAEAILARLANGPIEVKTVPFARITTVAFDARQLVRWNIPEHRLPAGSAILFREPNLWRDRRRLVITAIVVTLAQSLLIVTLVFERRRRQRAEVEIRRSLTNMAHLDRRAALGELATSLAHEISQPLNAILQNAGAAQMLLNAEGPVRVDELRDILTDIQHDDARAGDVVHGMHALLQKHELKMTMLDANALARDTLALTLPDASARGIQVDLELKDGLPPIRGDRVHLQQVLLNLLLNGLDAVVDMPAGRRRLSLRTEQRDGNVELSVKDSGAGLGTDRPSQIFESFYTTKDKGLGMGLSIARSIIEAHHGRIGAENNTDGGATVWFSVPAGR